MDKPGKPPYIHVKGNGNALERGELKRTFSKFGNVVKIFVNLESNYANVFFDQPEAVTEACAQYSDVDGFTVVPGFARKPHRKPPQKEFEDLNFSNNLEMEDLEAHYVDDLVDINGRPLMCLKAEDDELYVCLKDIKKAGFKVFSRKLFESITLSNEEVLEEVEAKISHYGMECLLETHRVFTENQMINMFERVKAVVFKDKSKPVSGLAQNRRIINPQEANFKLSIGNNASPSAGNTTRRISFDTQVAYLAPRNKRATSLTRTGAGNSLQNGNQSQENRESPLEQAGHRYSGEVRGRAAVKEMRPPRVAPTDDESNAFEQRSSARGRPQEKPSMSFVKVDTPEQGVSNASEQRSSIRGKLQEKPSTTFAKVEPTEQESQEEQISNVSGTENISEVARVMLDVLDKGPLKIKVTYLFAEKPIFYAQLLKNLDIVEQILLHVNKKDALLPVIASPKKDMLVVVLFEEIWYRGVVIREHGLPGSALVELLDYGNRVECKDNIRQMSEDMKKIPAQAIRFTVNTHTTVSYTKLEEDQELEVTLCKQFENQQGATYLVTINRILGLTEEVETSPVEKQPLENVKPSPKPVEKQSVKPSPKPAAIDKCFMEIAKSSAKIAPGEMVFIVNHLEDKLIVKNKEMAVLSKKIISLVASIEKKPVTDPKVGQYVLCNSFDFGNGFFRAIIKDINGKVASLELIDFSIDETSPLTSLKNIDETLASLPPAQIVISYPPLKKITDEGLEYLSSLIIEKIKIKLTEADGQTDFTVNGELLSTKITPKPSPKKSDAIPSHREPTVAKIVEPEPVSAVVQNKEYVKVTYDDMAFEEPKPGMNHYFCYLHKGALMSIVKASQEIIALIDKLYVEELEDNEPYDPELFEMCLANYEDAWFRCIPIDEAHGKFEVLFVDYGNLLKVTRENIRKLPENLKTIPILAISAELKGVGSSETVYKRLKELIKAGAVLKVDVKVEEKDPNCQHYPVEIPEIYEVLKKEGLI